MLVHRVSNWFAYPPRTEMLGLGAKPDRLCAVFCGEYLSSLRGYFRKFAISESITSGLIILSCLFCLSCTSCSLFTPKEPNSDLSQFAAEPLTPEQSRDVLETAGGNWFFGQGFGDTLINIGGVVVFPPYAAVLLGNAALSLAGYEPLEFSQALPDGAREGWRETYGTVASGPGRLTSVIAGREYRTEEIKQDEYDEVLSRYAAQRSDDEAVS